MKNRIKHALYLMPAIFLLVIWTVAGPSVLEQKGTWAFFAIAVVLAAVVSWCITLFVHALSRDRL